MSGTMNQTPILSYSMTKVNLNKKSFDNTLLFSIVMDGDHWNPMIGYYNKKYNSSP